MHIQTSRPYGNCAGLIILEQIYLASITTHRGFTIYFITTLISRVRDDTDAEEMQLSLLCYFESVLSPNPNIASADKQSNALCNATKVMELEHNLNPPYSIEETFHFL
jgi:hypothetical protein